MPYKLTITNVVISLVIFSLRYGLEMGMLWGVNKVALTARSRLNTSEGIPEISPFGKGRQEV